MFIKYQLLSLFNFAFMCQENFHARNGLKFRFVIKKSEFVNLKSCKKDFMFYVKPQRTHVLAYQYIL